MRKFNTLINERKVDEKIYFCYVDVKPFKNNLCSVDPKEKM